VYFDGKSHRLFVMIDNFTSGLSLSLSLSLVGACRCILTFLTHVLVFEERRHCSSPFSLANLSYLNFRQLMVLPYYVSLRGLGLFLEQFFWVR
jgi:hypothetical protein